MDRAAPRHRGIDGAHGGRAGQVDPEDRSFGGDRRLPVVRSAGRARSADLPCDEGAHDVRHPAGARCRRDGRPHSGHLPAARHGGGSVGSAQLEEIRAAIDEFRASGKFVVAYAETYSQGATTSPRWPMRSTSSPKGARLVGLRLQSDVLQGAARQARPEGRGLPPDGLHLQERRGALHPHEDVRRQPPSDAGARRLDVGDRLRRPYAPRAASMPRR